MKKKVIVIGAGPGGLTAAMLLAHRGFDVTVYEKREEVGGRSGRIQTGGYTFDVGSTLLMMRFVLDEVFELAGRHVEEEIELVELDPMYRLYFGERALTIWSDHERMREEIARLYPGDEDGLTPMLQREWNRFQHLYDVLQGVYPSLAACLFDRKVLRAATNFALGRSLHDVIASYFTSEELRVAFSFQSQYLGMSPWECPGGFAIVPFVEHAYGIYHVTGGLNQVAAAMARVVSEEGGEVQLGTPVKRLLLDERKVVGVELADGREDRADEVVINADFGYAMTELVDEGVLHKYSPKNVAKRRYSSSTFMLYLGLDTLYSDLAHHSFFFADDVRQNMADLYSAPRLSDDVSMYVCNPSVTDPTMAPEGHSALYVLVPVANLATDIDWDRERDRFRDMVLDRLERRAGLTGLREHLRQQVVISPTDWRDELNVYLGAPFSLAHNLTQLLCFRPHNRFEELGNCYLAGGGTNPGSGMPTIWESGRIASDLISRKHGLEVEPPRPLPPPRL